MALGFLRKEALWVLEPTGDADALGAPKRLFRRLFASSCYVARRDLAQDGPLGREERGRWLVITPPLGREPLWVEVSGKVFRVKELRKFKGFGFSHWELALEEELGEVVS